MPRPNRFWILFSIAAAMILSIELAGHFYYYFTHDQLFIWQVKNQFDVVRFSPYDLMEFKPNVKARMRNYPDNLETDRYGFVHNGYKKPIDAEDFLVFVLGGSTVEGRGASSNATTIPAFLEKILNTRGGLDKKHVRVVNAGFSGHISYQELAKLSGKILPEFNPDMVISVNGRNDAHFAIAYGCGRWKINWQPYYDQLSFQINKGLYEPTFSGALYRFLIKYSFFMTVAGKLSMDNEEKWCSRKPERLLIKKAAKAYTDNLVLMRTRADLSGVRYMGFVQPILSKKFKPLSPEEKRFQRNWEERFGAKFNYFDEADKFYDDLSRNSVRRPWLYDIANTFSKEKSTMYFDSVHYNDQGNRIIAKRIARIILRGMRKNQAK